MDPEANMKRQIELAREIVTIDGRDEDNPSTQAAEAVYWLGVQLAELILKQEGEFTLIAAAPELLAACKRLEAQDEITCHPEAELPVRQIAALFNSIRQVACAAIAKAEGRGTCDTGTT